MAGGCSRCSQEFQSNPFTRFGFKCWPTIAPLTVKILRLQSGLKFPSQAVWSARLPGPCTPITLCGLLFTWACWAVAAVGRLALAPGHRLVVVVSLPSLVLPHNSASKGTAPSCAADRSCPSPVSRQLRHLRPLLLLLLLLPCRPSWCRETQAVYFDKNCGLFGCSWLFLVWSGLVVRRDLCGREPGLEGGWQPHSQPKSVAVSRQSYRELKSRLGIRSTQLQS